MQGRCAHGDTTSADLTSVLALEDEQTARLPCVTGDDTDLASPSAALQSIAVIDAAASPGAYRATLAARDMQEIGGADLTLRIEGDADDAADPGDGWPAPDPHSGSDTLMQGEVAEEIDSEITMVLTG